ncbi:MAG TPA: hypothetical protein VG434_03775, partial [Sphingomicrobium sp.]|nr:hypothetical protein [Sphingomicrobium sp.]
AIRFSSVATISGAAIGQCLSRSYGPNDDPGGRMDNQSRRDLLVGGAIVVMFLGAFILPFNALGLLLIGGGALLILTLILKAVRE